MRPSTPIALRLACALALFAGCAEPRVGATTRRDARSAAAVPVPPRGVPPRVFVLSAPETIRLSPEEPRPEPTAGYVSLEAVRDSIGAILRRAVDPSDTAIHVSRIPVTFTYWYVADSTSGWAYHVVVTDTSSCPESHLGNQLEAVGWVPHYGYSADGPDGSVIGYVTREYLCVIDARWDGGDDSDSTYVPVPGCEVTLTCVKRHPKDVISER